MCGSASVRGVRGSDSISLCILFSKYWVYEASSARVKRTAVSPFSILS